MLAWTKQNTMQRAMRTVLEWPQNHATSKHYTYYDRSTALERSEKITGGLNRFYGISPSAFIMAQNIQLFGPRGGFLIHQWITTGNK